jgi:Zn-dependent protease
MNPLPPAPAPPDSPRPVKPWRKALSTLALSAVALLKFGAKLKFFLVPFLKFLPVLLKSGGSMLLMIGVYASQWGWKYAVGFVLLLLLHECGHLLAAKRFGLSVGAPVFIPFMGAHIALREAPPNAWVESWVGIGGPLLGSASALACHLLGHAFDSPLLVALAWTGYWLNLFNLIPVSPLDGGRIATAITPWLWVPGCALLGWMLWRHPTHFLLWIIGICALPRLLSLLRKRTPTESLFYAITPSQRGVMASLYFLLLAALWFGMQWTHPRLP